MNVKRFKIQVSEDLDEIIKRKIKTFYNITSNFSDIKINLDINCISQQIEITIIKEGKKIVEQIYTFNSIYQLYCIISVPIDDESFYLLKLEKEHKRIYDSLYESKDFCKVIENPTEYIGGYNAYYDVVYTNFASENEFIKLCLKIIHMQSDEKWQELFRQKLDYAGYIIEKGKYNITILNSIKEDNKKQIIFKLMMLTCVFLNISKEDIEETNYKRIKDMACNTYDKYISLLNHV